MVDILGSVLDNATRVQRVVDRIAGLCSGKGKSGTGGRGGALTRRVEDLPGLIQSSGFIPAITFYMSKADNELYPLLYRLLHNPDESIEQPSDRLLDRLCDEIGGKEAAGYTLALALTVKALEDLRVLEEGNSSIATLAEKLLEMRKKRVDAYASRLLVAYMNEAKKLLRALYSTD